MQDQELLNKVITVSGKEEKMQGGKPVIKIKDQDNLTYTVYKTKQDGTESAAWKQMPSLEDVVQIGFVEQKGEYEGKPVTYRTIRVFNKDIGNGVVNHSTVNASPTPNKINPLYDKPKEEKGDKFWEQQAYEKCCSLWAASILHRDGMTTDDAELAMGRGEFWKLFQAIKAEGRKRFFDLSGANGGQTTAYATNQELTPVPPFKHDQVTTELPTIQVQENIAEEWDKTYNCTVCGTQGATHGDGHDCIPFNQNRDVPKLDEDDMSYGEAVNSGFFD